MPGSEFEPRSPPHEKNLLQQEFFFFVDTKKTGLQRRPVFILESFEAFQQKDRLAAEHNVRLRHL